MGDLLQNDDEKYIVGEVSAIFFQNPSNYYKVLLIKVQKTNAEYKENEIVVTGNFGRIQEEVSYKFYGEFKNHPKYGEQFESTRYTQDRPTSREAVISYLSSSRFQGIGEKTAEKIVDTIGDQTIDKILKDPEILKDVPGLAPKKRKNILNQLDQGHTTERTILSLNEYGLTNALAYKIYQLYEEKTLEIIQTNPYQLAEDVENIGFKRADALAERVGIEADAPERIKAGILYSLKQLCFNDGHTFAESEPILLQTIKELEDSRPFIIDPEKVADNLIILVDESKIIQEESRLYIPSLYASEWGISSAMERILQGQPDVPIKIKKIKHYLKEIEKENGILYGRSQKEAILEAIFSPVFILTGGPGTGKTTVLNGIVQLFAKIHDLGLDPYAYKDETFPFLLAAPTGRAAKRMNESTGLPSSTIHRLLGFTGQEETADDFESRTLSGRLLVVDEMSMVDTWLANQLFKAIPQDMQVILVGDKDQLPSVGPGQVLHDLLESGRIPAAELNEIYRQGNESSIIPLAHQIKNGTLPADFHDKKADRSFIPCHTRDVEKVLSQIIQKAIEKGYTAQDIQILAPMYRGPAGINQLNETLQNLFNPNEDQSRKEVKFIDKVYRIGDKVLQLVNDSESNVFNGDMGVITGITLAKDSEDKVDELTIAFDANEVTYRRNEWNKITLAYCCSIHKAQGSEFDMVLLPMVMGYNRMLKKDLLYTAITRASKKLILLGNEQAFQRALQSHSKNRQTSLKERMTGSFDNSEAERIDIGDDEKPIEEGTTNEKNSSTMKKYILTIESIKKGTIDPLIGMDGLKPDDFKTTN